MNLHPDFVTLIVKGLPDELHNLLMERGKELIVAGGFCRDAMTGQEPKDVDVFAVSAKAMAQAVEEFDWTERYTARHTANAESFIHDEDGPDVQFITRVYFVDHEEAIRSFDFSICQVGVYYDQKTEKWIGIASEEFLEDLPNFKMRYMAPERDEDPGASVLRMLKFVARGWKIAEADVARVIGRFVSKLQDDLPAFPAPPANECVATEVVKKAFRRIGYAGKQAVEPVNEEVPF